MTKRIDPRRYQPTRFERLPHDVGTNRYSRIARCPKCGHERAIVHSADECVECEARSFKASQKINAHAEASP